MTRAASLVERSLMISARSEGCSRGSCRCETESRTSVGDEIVDRRDVVPRQSCVAECGRRLAARKPIGAESAQQTRKTDVGRDDAQSSARACDLDVVDANELAAFDVDDLLVEQILDQYSA